MKINFDKEIIEYRGRKIKFKDIIKVKKIEIDMYVESFYGFFQVRQTSIVKNSYVCIQLYNSEFICIYDNKEKFDKVLECIKDKKLDCLENMSGEEYNLERELWKRLFCITFYKYGIDGTNYERSLYDSSLGTHGKNCEEKYGFWAAEYWKNPKEIYGRYDKTRIEDYFVHDEKMEEVYQWFNGVLPGNIEKTKIVYKEKETKERVNYITELCGNADDKDGFIRNLEEKNGDVADNWQRLLVTLREYNDYLYEIIKESYYPKDYIKDYIELIEYGIKYGQEKYIRLQELVEKEKCNRIKEELENEFGPIGEIRKGLRQCIDQLKFDELVELYRTYETREYSILNKSYYSGDDCSKNIILNEYKDAFRFGKILISDKLNQINRNKANMRYIAPDLIEEAMLFYYETDTIEKANQMRSSERYSQNKESGEIGEQKVEYALKWLDKKYVQIEKRSKDRVGKNVILLYNKAFIDEKQEFDHIVVSEKGVFNIETKNYAGKIEVDNNGNWKRIKGEVEEGIRNPLQQIRQHEKVLRSIIPEGINIISILCIANDKSIIEGTENFPIPIIKSDMLVEYIENYKGVSVQNEIQQKECVDAIYKHMLI